jgi:hypothetical protein
MKSFMKSFKTGEQGGLPSNIRNSRAITIRTTVTAFLGQYHGKGDNFLHHSVTDDKHGSTTMSETATTIIQNENTFQKEVQISVNSRKSDTLLWDPEGPICWYYQE